MMTGGGRGRRGGATLARHGACLVTLLLASAMALTLAPVARGQDVEWTRQFGTGGSDGADGVSVDGSGVYVSGATGGTLPGQTYSGGDRDAFVRKYDAGGSEAWTRQFGSAGNDAGVVVTADASGVYVSGYAAGALPGQTSSGGYDVFVRKYTSAGTEVWTRQFGSGSDDFPAGISVYASGVYVVGKTLGTLPGQTASGSGDVFVRKYDSAGTEAWTRQFGTSADDSGNGIAVDASGVYVAGWVPSALPGQTYLGGVSDIFVRKYDASGTEQ